TDSGVFYNVTKAVGRVAPNELYDVLLVQYMLRHIYYPNQEPPDGAIVVDGWYGPITGAYIVAFQKQARAQGYNLAQDGIVNRARGAVSSISKNLYTIVALNGFLKSTNPIAWSQLPSKVPLTPAEGVGSPYNNPQVTVSGGI